MREIIKNNVHIRLVQIVYLPLHCTCAVLLATDFVHCVSKIRC